MIAIRKADERGHANYGWLDTRHTFSFSRYYDPRHMGFRTLRVMNEDRVQPGMGFGTHAHRDMEIVSYVLEGAMAHKDSMGTGSILRPGELQLMTAGSGITHSEFNASESEPLHFYQIWIEPETTGLEPSYEQKAFPVEKKRDRLRLVASRDGRDGSLRIHQDANIFLADLSAGNAIDYELQNNRHAWLQILRGSVQLNGSTLTAGDGASVSDQNSISFRAVDAAEAMLFDLA